MRNLAILSGSLLLGGCGSFSVGGMLDFDPRNPCGEDAEVLLEESLRVYDLTAPETLELLEDGFPVSVGKLDRLNQTHERLLTAIDERGYELVPRVYTGGWITTDEIIYHPGNVNPQVPDRNITSTMVHEFAHVVQWQSEDLDFGRDYLDPVRRAALEGTAAVLESHARLFLGQSDAFVDMERQAWAENYEERFASNVSSSCMVWMTDMLWEDTK